MFAPTAWSQTTPLPELGTPLTSDQAQSLANLALAGLDREFPNKPAIVLAGPETVVPPRQLFPAFYGCFDWHSSVHGHWMLVRILKFHPDVAQAAEIRRQLNNHLSAENLQIEADFFAADINKSFERMYGWAWLFRLVQELEEWDDPDARRWRQHLKPLEDVLLERTLAYLPRLSHPIRTGEHPDTGFALGQLLDYCRASKNTQLEGLIVQRAQDYFGSDRDYPGRYEPSGQDFFSSGWNEADLMRRVLKPDEFSGWLKQFFPGLETRDMGNLLTPVEVTDVTDGKLVHLAGLNLSRAWCQQAIAAALPESDSRRQILIDAAKAHTAAGMKTVFSGHYEGEHWLGTFAIYVLTRVGVPPIR